MKLILLLFLVFNISLCAQDDWGDTEARLPDTSRIMKAYGFSGGTLTRSAAIIDTLNDETAENTGLIEKTPVVDTAEEFITAAFFSQIVPENPDSRDMLTGELPPGRTGSLMVGAMWLKKGANMRKEYDRALTYIVRHSTASKEQITEYYRLAVSARIEEITARVLAGVPKSYYTYTRERETAQTDGSANAIDILKRYYTHPSDETYASLVEAVRRIGEKGTKSDKDMTRFRLLVRIIDDISPDLRKRIAADM
ncbi:MAG: hypothetical protein ACOC2H_08915 [Spirochaetota bacterium]